VQPPVAPKKAIVGLVAVDDIDSLKYKEILKTPRQCWNSSDTLLLKRLN
jgi:hypothetical protein